MGRDSPVRVRGSPPRRSPARRERSRERYKSSRRDESPVRDKRSGRDRSPARELPRSSSSPLRHREPRRGRSPPERERNSAHVRSPRRERSPSASPRTKRLRKAHAERGSEKAVDNGRSEDRGTREGRGVGREHERTKVKVDRKQPQNNNEMTDRNYDRNHERGSDRNGHRERGVDRDADNERKERRSRRDDVDGKSSRARHKCSISPVDHHGRSRHKSRSPQPASGASERDEITDSRRSERGNSEDDSVARMKAAEEALAQKQQPSFELSGKLAAETNRVKGVTLLFNEPSDARKPDLRWQLFVFKNGEMLNDPLYIHRQSCYLFGRERRVADVPTDHPSCSKQHAVLQFRQVTNEGPDGTTTKKVKPYLMDLGSTNKTFINDSPMEPQRYYELFEKDTIKFGNSSREYVLLHENSAA